MPAISVGSVEVDVLPNATGVRQRMQNQLVPAANQVGDEVGRIIGRYLTSHVANAFTQGINQGGRRAQPAAARQGQSTGSTFGRSFKATLEAALAALPEVRLRANSTDAEREIYQIRAQMRALSDARIGIDVSTATANAAIGQLQARLARLSASDADVAVRVDAGAAAAQLASFQAQVNRLDGSTANVDVDTRSATANLHLLTTAALAFGPAILPVLPVVAAGLGAIAAAGVAAAVGVGAVGLVAIPAFKGIGSALQAQKAAQDAATAATYQGAQASGQGASQALQQASAAQALATAERNGARQIAQAQQQVKQAKQQAADAIAQAAVRNEQAARRVQDAEQSLADAQRDAKRAQTDLSDARKQAVQELQDLNSQLAGSQLDQRQAVLDLQDAERELRAVQAKGSAATAGELQRAQLNYDRAKQNLTDQKTETQRLGQETKAANKAGVEGSDTFKSAQERLAEAQQKVADQAQAVKDAQAEAGRTQLETARQVAQAQQRVGEATANVAAAQQSAADAVSSAQRQIESASISAAGGIDQAAVAQAKYEAELAKLTPSARDTFDAFVDLRSAFGDWSKSLQPAVMPIFTKAFEGLKNSLPGLTPFVVAAADAIKGLQDRASAGFKSPWWKEFKSDLEGSVGPAITGLGISFGRIFKGMAGIIQAFLPHMDGISAKMQDITGKFAAWGTSLKGSPEFERFLSYSAQMAPRVWEALRSIAGAAISVGQALAPVSAISLGFITYLSQGVQWVADNVPWLITIVYGMVTAMYAWRLAMLLWTGVTWLASAAMTAFSLVVSMTPLGWVALAIAGVAAAIFLLYTKCEWFRGAVEVVWGAIVGAGQVVIDWFAGPFVRFFTETIPGAFQSTLDWVKNNWPWIIGALGGPVGLGVVWVIKHWDGLMEGLSDGWGWVKDHVLYPIRDFFTKTIPGWATLLRDKVVGAFVDATVGIKKGWDKLEGIAKKPIQYVIDIVYNDGLRGVWNKVAGAFGAPKLPYFKFASGGVMPGYTPGRDVHKFISPTGGALELSGGEAIMRPEFTRAVGSGFVNSMNALARSGGAQGIKSALAPVFGGNPSTPTDRSLRYAGGGITQSFADGGIFGWIGGAANKVAGAGSTAWNKIKEGASWLGDTLEASARAGVKHIVDPLLAKFPGMDTGFGKMIRKIPDRILDALFGYSKEADKKGAGGIGGPKIQAALKWAKTQDGKPYQWAGNGDPSWDCCIVGTVRVYGPNGATPIQDVQAGDEVYSYVEGKLTVQTVTAAWKSKTQPVFKVRTRNRAVTASANHPFMRLVQTSESEHVKGGKRGEQIPAKYGIEWARLDELKRGDMLVQPREMASREVANPVLPDGTQVTEDIAWLLGLFVGDGYMNRNTIRICVYDDLSVRAQMVFRSLGVNSFTAQKHGVVASSVQLVKDLTGMGFHKPGAEKRVPDVVWTWNQELRQAFLDGYCDADGHRPKNQAKHGDRTYSSASRELIEDVRAMHVMLGHPVSNVSTNNRVKPITIRGKVVKKALPLHSFTVWAGEGRGEGALRRLPGIADWLDAGDFTLAKVLEVSDEGVQETYDLEVEGAHNFIADGVVVHNSGFVSAIESVIRGQKPHRRWSTHAFSGKTAPPGWVYHGNSPFRVGITAAGVGHTAGTLGKTKVESRGGDGVIVGSGARGYNDKLFTSWYGFKPGSYDSGGYLQPGLNLAYNGTGRPEPVFTTRQANALTSMASRGASGPMAFEGNLTLDSGEFLGRVRGEATAVMHAGQQQLIGVLNAS